MRSLQTLLVVTLLCAGAAGCKKKAPAVTDEDADLQTTYKVQDVEQALSIVAVSPGSAAVNQPFTATVRGAGFVSTPRVFIGSQPATRVVFESDRSLTVEVPGLPEGDHDLEVINPAGQSAVLRQAVRVLAGSQDCAALTLYFALDSSSLAPSNVRVLEQQLSCLKSSNAQLRIEGHCDERGTTDYNLALGERRAEAVASWLVTQGLPRTRVRTISYGEERPAEQGRDERAYSRNRRAELRLMR